MRGAVPAERSTGGRVARWGCGMTLLLSLVVAGACVMVGTRMDEAVDPLDTPSDDCDDSPITVIRAAAAGRSDEVRSALDRGDSPDVRDDQGNTPLACAGAPGHAATVEVLLEAGADPDTLARDGDTVVEDAVIFCRDEVLELLLHAGADPAPSRSTASPVQQAIDLGRPSTTLLLMGAGATLDPIETTVVGRPDSSPCPVPAPEGRSAALRVALDAGSDPDRVLRAALHLPVYDVVAPALAVGAEPDLDLGASGQPFRSLGCLSADIDDPTDPDLRGCDPTGGLTFLLDGEIAAPGSTTTVAGAPAPTTPLLHAAWDGQTDVVRALLDAGADPDLLGPRAMTPLHAAAGAGRADVAGLLLPVTARSVPDGPERPSELAELAGHTDLAAHLRSGGS